MINQSRTADRPKPTPPACRILWTTCIYYIGRFECTVIPSGQPFVYKNFPVTRNTDVKKNLELLLSEENQSYN
jgi:hypothetical protein